MASSSADKSVSADQSGGGGGGGSSADQSGGGGGGSSANGKPDKSVYDLGEDEQLALAMANSLDEDADPELTGGGAGGVTRPVSAPRPASRTSSAAGPAAGAAASSSQLSSSAVEAPPVSSVPRRSAPELTGGDSGGGPPFQRDVDPETSLPSPDSSAAISSYAGVAAEHPEAWHGGLADEAGGGGGRPRVPATPPSTVLRAPPAAGSAAHPALWSPPAAGFGSSGSGSTGAPSAAAGGADQSEVNTELRKALEFAHNKMFEESEACLAALCARQPELRQSREVQAACEAVSMCKQFHAAKP